MIKKQEKYDPLKVEKDILSFWKKKGTYKKAKAKNKGKKSFYFLDGPPYTSGKIHLGTAWNKPLKDMVLRYKRMKGFDVWDRAGYDMHGLPVELKVEKKLGIKYKEDIPKYGVAKFIKECRAFAMKNLKIMNKDFIRLGTWLDYDNAYMSVENSFIEGVWWLVKKAHQNKRLYEGEKSMHWCAHCATSLAKHELEYENIKDDSIFVKFPVKGKKNEFLIIWTTTPWTIPYNLGVMVHPKFDYIKAKVDDETWIVAKGLASLLISGVADKKYKILEEFKGEKLKGLSYLHPFSDIVDYEKILGKNKKIHTVVMSDEYVDLGSGSGLVHMAPGCGPEDYEVGYKNGIPPFNNLNEYGVFPENMGKFSGFVAKKNDDRFIEELDNKGVLIATTKVEHDYAHCWRCKNPVIFKTTKQWFFKVEDLREKMKKLNKDILWTPDWAGSRQFDSWLDNLRDNGVTRQRFWGTPLPVWKCSKCSKYDVMGSSAELKKKAGKLPNDLHKPWIDKVSYKCKCGGVKKRTPDIMDVWVDAGSTSWNCLDYPSRKDYFKKYFPADFILEGKDQIRGWFNLLLVASMVSMNKPSFKAVYMHGFVSDALGRKMSKSVGNVISPYEVIDEYGADSFRYYTLGGANPGLDLNYNFDDIKVKRRNLEVLWNLHNLLLDFSAGLYPQTLSTVKGNFGVEEKYMLSKLNSTIKKVTLQFDKYLLNETPLAVEELFLELSRSYIQFVRERMNSGTKEEKQAVLYVLYNSILESLKLFAPISPFITEKIYQNLKNRFKLKVDSIHLYDWPSHDDKMMNKKLEADMGIAKACIQSILAAREKAQLGVRWPVKEVIVETTDEKLKKSVLGLKELIKTQCNIKDIDVVEKFEKVKKSVKPDFKQLGPDFGELAPKIVAHLINESADAVLKHLAKDGKYKFKIDGKDVEVVSEHLIIEREVDKDYVDSEFKNSVLYLNKKLDAKLEAEGFSREVMRRVQSLRKKSGLHKSDSIKLFLVSKDMKMLEQWHEQIKDKVGAKELTITASKPKKKFKHESSEKVKGKEFLILFN
ncbi:isoleucine--tRNA ligase [Candidatus Woesearchaeota archaeon]|nr:isoleucine--tRNA ligase [Candidatus Woesearchaeota archaeon]